MGLETGSFIADFVLTNPASSDLVSEGDDHLRLIKDCVQRTFPGFGVRHNQVDARSTGYTILATDNTKHFVIDNSATSTVTLSLPAAASVTSGFSLMVTTRAGATVIVDGNAAEQINGSANQVMGDRETMFIFYTGTTWRANFSPSAENGYVYHSAVGYSATVSMLSALRVSGTASFDSIIVTNGQVRFPAAQNASADANTLDDYEEGTWTPTVTCDTPGDLSVTYSSQVGRYTKIGRQVHAQFYIVTSAFTHTTAAGSMRVGGIPFSAAGGLEHAGSLSRSEGMQTVDTDPQWFSVQAEGSASATFVFRRNEPVSGVSGGVNITDTVSGTNKVFVGAVTYIV